MVKRAAWLSVTPEPERELPEAVATLAGRGAPDAAAVAAERRRIERLIVGGSQRRWLHYLHGVVRLIEARAPESDPAVQRACARAIAVISNHHNLLLALPGHSLTHPRLTATDRARLQALKERAR